jgi:uncharacterized protein
VILTDAGPLVAILDRSDPDHVNCVQVLGSLTYPLLTTWPAFTEAMYLLGQSIGWKAQQTLWKLLERGDVELAVLDQALLKRTHDLMGQYYDCPMDLADATLVALAESRSLSRIFTLDADFRIYRLKGRKAFEIIPT